MTFQLQPENYLQQVKLKFKRMTAAVSGKDI